jgi:hypothetical protein
MADNIREEDFYQPDNGLDVFEEGRDVADKVDNPDDLGDVCDAGNALELSSIILIHEFQGERVYGGAAADIMFNYFQLGGKQPAYKLFLNVTDAVFAGSPESRPDA